MIYLTLGTAFGTPELLRTAIAGLAALDAEVVVAAGRVPVEQLGEIPDHVSVHPWVSQAELLPLVDLVVHHGGSGTTLGALAAGVPQLLLPQGADQFANADTLSAAGVAVRLLPGEVDASAIAEQAHRLLPQRGDVEQRGAALAVAEEIARMPSPAAVARLLPEYAA